MPFSFFIKKDAIRESITFFNVASFMDFPVAALTEFLISDQVALNVIDLKTAKCIVAFLP